MAAELAALVPRWIGDGVLVRADGTAVAVLAGGAVPWGLTSAASQATQAQQYHRLLMSLEYPVVVMQLDAPPAALAVIATFDQAAARSAHPLHGAILSALADRLDAQAALVRTKQTLWLIPGAATARRVAQRVRGRTTSTRNGYAEDVAVQLVRDRARSLAPQLASLTGQRVAPMAAEALAQLCYRTFDPVRAQRFPMDGDLLGRVRTVLEGSR